MKFYRYMPDTKRYGGAVHKSTQPDNTTTVEPPEFVQGKYIVWLDGEWGYEDQPKPDIQGMVGDKITELKQACRSEIFAGFDSDALGATHHYPTKQDANNYDQTNLIAQHSDALNNSTATYKIICQDGNGAWARREHTAAQTIEVGETGLRFVAGLKDVLDGKIQQVLTIQSDDTLTDDEKRTRIEAITW